MKLSKISFAILGGASIFLSVAAHAENQREEIPVARVFVPGGFDDNDTVEIVIDGELPNSCYSLEKSEISVDPTKHEIIIRQFAIRQNEGPCALNTTENALQFQTPVPFTDTLTVGNLGVGTYKAVYFPQLGVSKSRRFGIARSTIPSVDTLPYAAVTEVSVPDIVEPGEDVLVKVSGILNNTCYELNEEVGVQIEDDIAVILPTVRIDTTVPKGCLQYIRPFRRLVNIGKLPPERYLVHTRSMHGKSVNRVFSVAPDRIQ